MRYPISYNFWSFEEEISQYPPGSQEPLENWDLYLPVEVNQKSLLRSWLLAHAAGWWSLWEGAALLALSGRGRCGRAVCQGPIALPLLGSAHASFTCLVSLLNLTPQAPSTSSSSAPRAHFCQELVTEFGECVWLMQGRMRRHLRSRPCCCDPSVCWDLSSDHRQESAERVTS